MHPHHKLACFHGEDDSSAEAPGSRHPEDCIDPDCGFLKLIQRFACQLQQRLDLRFDLSIFLGDLRFDLTEILWLRFDLRFDLTKFAGWRFDLRFDLMNV